MGWITVGEIQLYSVAQDISDLTKFIFDIIMSLVNPFVLMIFLLFIVSMIIYILHHLAKNLEGTGDGI